MARELPAHPNLTQLEKQAKDLEAAAAAGDPAARARLGAVGVEGHDITLREARLALAREYGFPGWHALSAEVGRRMVDQGDLHRWFGVELNNSVWNEIDSAGVDASSPIGERERLLYSAYASAYHWIKVGSVANRARGEHLVARTAIQVGLHDVALRHARRCLELVEANPEDTEDWDLGFALEALARAEAANGLPSAAETRRRAEEAVSAIADPQDRAIVESQLGSGDWFGLA